MAKYQKKAVDGRTTRKQDISPSDLRDAVAALHEVAGEINAIAKIMEKEHIPTISVDGADRWKRAVQLAEAYIGNVNSSLYKAQKKLERVH